MKNKLILIFIVILLIPTVLAITDITDKPTDIKSTRVIAHTNSFIDRTMFRIQGCKIIHELNDATAMECPEAVASNFETDEVYHVMDLQADKQIKADLVWPSYNGTGTTVAVLDTGVDYNHPELKNSIAGGKSFVSYTTDYMDDYGHGTHVSGIITADGVDADAKGVAPGAGIWMAKVCDSSGSCYSSDIATAIQYVVNNHIAKVMSISLGGGGTSGANCDSDYLASQINWAYSNGVVAVIAAGNSGNSIVSSPACASKAIAVAAVDSSDTLAYFSSYGNALKDHGVAAPGVNIYSSLPSNSYASWSGTSMATPHVSATVALILQKDNTLTPNQIRTKIFSSADCLNNKYGTCPNTKIGTGRVDAYAAVNSVSPPTTTTTTTIPSTTTIPITTTTIITTTTTTTTIPPTKCWSGTYQYLLMDINQAKKFCKCAQGTYGYKSYNTVSRTKTAYYYVDSGDNVNWAVSSKSTRSPINQVKCSNSQNYPTNRDYYR
jgi:subtilisin family serine protease